MNERITKEIGRIKFHLLSPEKVKKLSKAKIVTPELYDMDGYPVEGGLMDLRLGAIDPGVRCRSCGGRIKECVGHSGHIELAKPVLHIKYLPFIELGLKCFCNSCGKVLLDEKEIEKLSPNDRVKKAKNKTKCPHCNSSQEKIKLDKPYNFYIGRKRIFPTDIRKILEKVSDEELSKLGIDFESSRPEWAVLTYLLVPPVTIRPSIILESGERSEDDLTHKLSDIIRANQRLWENLNAGAPEVIIEDLWDLLQFHITTFFDNSVAGVPPARHRSGQPLKTITERIKGKEGRIRKNLSGKRVNYSARTVVSPDTFMNINEIGVPLQIAKIVTVNETVNDLNIERMKKLIQKAGEYPGANYVIRTDGKKKKISEELKNEILEEIDVGYEVERHLQDGDVVLFNRHPSLHKGSLMAHYVKVLPGKTFRIHPATVFPYNADFDGDEMNIHSPQTEEARAEAKILLDVQANLISSKNNTNFVGSILDSTTGNYLLGLDELSKKDANQLLYSSNIDFEVSKNKISGNEVFSLILPKIDFSNKAINIKNGKIVNGIINKTLFGSEDGELIKELDKNIGREKTFEIIKNAFDLGKNYLTNRGISVSLNDLDLDEKVIKAGEKVIKDSEEKVKKIIEDYNKGIIEILPGKSAEESREIKILGILNEIRTKIGEIVKKEFPEINPMNHMMKSGGKGNIISITQMANSVGQQQLKGKRIDFGYTNRTLSFFEKGELSLRSRGFIENSFIKGLRPDEFFFGAITGRDSLMDTALRTPKSGYLYRRLSNAIQDFRMEYDSSVRDSDSNIIQFKYGGDCLDVSKLHMKGKLDPGEAIGLITAQSFGEPSTQMIMRTFHMAGVAEMQVTTGLPRLIEIFDARKKPSSPKMEIYLKEEFNNEKQAKKFAERIKQVKLKDICSGIDIDFGEKKIKINIDNDSLKNIQTSIKNILKKVDIKGFKLRESGNSIILDAKSENSFKEIYKIKEKLKETVISGIKDVLQVLVVKRGKDYVVLTLGTNLKKILDYEEVNSNKVISNDLHEVAKVFGIEVARQLIVDEIHETLSSQGLEVDFRHLELVADAITHTGEVKGITRMGIISQKSSILAKASFETPIKHFVNATLKGSEDNLSSVVENIILNQPVPVGTGLPGLSVKVIGPLAKETKKQKK
ncbi:MAG: DNA-directed RNA polymerase subunit A' [Minisyncoccales bacterium]